MLVTFGQGSLFDRSDPVSDIAVEDCIVVFSRGRLFCSVLVTFGQGFYLTAPTLFPILLLEIEVPAPVPWGVGLTMIFPWNLCAVVPDWILR